MHDKLINGVRVSIGFNVTALSVVVILIRTMPDIPVETQSEGNICIVTDNEIKCDQIALILHKTLNHHVEKHFKNMKETNEANVKKRFNSENTRRLFRTEFWEMRPTAQIVRKHISQPIKNGYYPDMVLLKHWNHARDLYDQNVFLENGVTYRNGRLVVPVSGTYLVYASTELFAPGPHENVLSDMEDRDGRLQLGLYKFNILEGIEVELARSSSTYCSDIINFSNSRVNTVVELNAGDELSVKVNKQTYLLNGGHSFFGLNLI